MPTQTEQFAQGLRQHTAEFGVELSSHAFHQLSQFYELLLKWNPRLHLVAPCSPKEFATRHVLESLTLLRHLPANVRIVDIGSGGGLPIIPCLLVRDDLHATLIESSAKKSIFLKEAVRVLGCVDRTQIVNARFEEIAGPETDFITCRALDRFDRLLPRLISWSAANSTLLLFVGEALRDEIKALVPLVTVESIPLSEKRFLVIARKDSA
jgi:16S rRNA (guanine527-N7)-methyltransferase